jgi:hypothetical protein
MDTDISISRRRKVRCSGTKPCCENCLRLNDNCHWPCHGDEQEHRFPPDRIMNLVNTNQRHVLLEIFFKTPHLDIMRPSIHRLSFDSTEINHQSEFLLVSIYCLSALYISESDVRSVFNGESAQKLSQRLANVAQKCSRDTSDQPSGTISPLSSLHTANLSSCINSGKSFAWLPRATLSDWL